MREVDYIVPTSLQAQLCKELNCEDLEVYEGKVIGVNYEEVECYYGHRKIEPTIVTSMTFVEAREWVNKNSTPDIWEKEFSSCWI